MPQKQNDKVQVLNESTPAKSGGAFVQNLLKLDPETPIPISLGADLYMTMSGKKYLPFIDKEDNLATTFLEAMLTSVTHFACVSTIVNSTVGDGVFVVGVEGEKVDKDFKEFTKCTNRKGHTLTEILGKAMQNFKIHGNAFLEVTVGEVVLKGSTIKSSKKYMKLKVHPVTNCRLENPDREDICNSVYIDRNFCKSGLYQGNLKKIRKVPIWSSNLLLRGQVWVDNGDGSKSTMLHWMNEIPGIPYYGLPDSCASLRNQVIEGNASQYNIDQLDNNFIAGATIVLKGSMSEDEALMNGRRIQKAYTGKGKAGRTAIISSENGIKDVDVVQHNTQKEGSYVELDKHNSDKIIMAHGWDSILAGLSRSSALGNGSTYIKSIWDAKEASVLKPYRKKLIEKIMSPIAQIWSDEVGSSEVSKYNFDFSVSMPFSYMSDINPSDVLQVNEGRELLGRKPDPKMEGIYINQVKKQNAEETIADKKDPDNS